MAEQLRKNALYQLNSEFLALQEKRDRYAEENGGAELPELEAEAELIGVEREEKIGQYALWHRDAKARAAMIKSEMDRLKKRMQSAEKEAEFAKNMLALVLEPGEKIKTDLYSLSWKLTPGRSNIIDETELPAKYRTEEVVTKIDGNLLLTDLRNGIDVPGAELVIDTNLLIS